MYDELLSGGEAGRGIVQGLSAGPSGEDEESEFFSLYQWLRHWWQMLGKGLVLPKPHPKTP